MKWRKVTPRAMVIVYYGCFAVFWTGIAATLVNADDLAGAFDALRRGGGSRHASIGIIALAAHAVAVVLLAWKANRWFFAHGPLAVAFCGVALVPLVRNVWLVPAFLYLIAVLHVWLASRRESLGSVQTTRRHSTASGPI